MPRINLLPWREELRAKRKKEFFLALFGAVLVGGLLGYTGKLSVRQMTAWQNERNTVLRDKIEELDRQIEEINELDAQKSRLIARMEIIDRLQRARPEAVHLVDELVGTLPEGAYLTEVSQIENRIEIRGSAQSSTRVSALMRNVEESEWLNQPELQIIQIGTNGPTRDANFTIFAHQINIDEETEELGL